METPTRELAHDLVQRLLQNDPFTGSGLGLREYDALLPDPSRAAEDDLAGDLAAFAARAEALTAQDPADAVTLDVVRTTCLNRLESLAIRPEEFTVSPMPLGGPPSLLAVFARSALVDPAAAGDYLERVKAAAGWIDGTSDRLVEGAERGRYPVAALLEATIAWADRTLAEPVPPAVLAPSLPEGWDGAGAWRDEVERVARDALVPALGRWRERLVALRDGARPDDEVGLGALPGGEEDYERAIAVHTTLSFSADELHRVGLEHLAFLEERARELGARLGLNDLAAVREAARRSTTALPPEEALELARAAVLRAEERAHEMMPQPLPGPCAVTPMPPTVAESGLAPHYTRPRLDGSRPGTYWFNTVRASAGAGWDLEPVAFHEAVPGHHSQLARQQHLAGLPLLQQLSLTVHSEGWGLYAERLAGEFGLYSGPEAEIGAVFVEMHRAARLVVDTGLHALGWSRSTARDFLLGHVALAEGFLVDEIDRYVAWPGQALAYLVGQREILRLREGARAALGDRFDLPAFNATLLDSGNVPMPVLARIVEQWVAAH